MPRDYGCSSCGARASSRGMTIDSRLSNKLSTVTGRSKSSSISLDCVSKQHMSDYGSCVSTMKKCASGLSNPELLCGRLVRMVENTRESDAEILSRKFGIEKETILRIVEMFR